MTTKGCLKTIVLSYFPLLKYTVPHQSLLSCSFIRVLTNLTKNTIGKFEIDKLMLDLMIVLSKRYIQKAFFWIRKPVKCHKCICIYLHVYLCAVRESRNEPVVPYHTLMPGAPLIYILYIGTLNLFWNHFKWLYLVALFVGLFPHIHCDHPVPVMRRFMFLSVRNPPGGRGFFGITPQFPTGH